MTNFYVEMYPIVLCYMYIIIASLKGNSQLFLICMPHFLMLTHFILGGTSKLMCS